MTIAEPFKTMILIIPGQAHGTMKEFKRMSHSETRLIAQ
jgi:hypothetical protein